MIWLRPMLVAVVMGMGGSCANIPAEDDSSVPAATSPGTAPNFDARLFFPAGPAAKAFSYSRTGPDGTKLLGSLSIFIMDMDHPASDPNRTVMDGLVHFEADAIVFSPEQGKAIRPTADWPTDRKRYPMHLAAMEEVYAFEAAMTGEAMREPANLAAFWVEGIRGYLGMDRRPTTFELVGVEQSSEAAPLSIRGEFREAGKSLGSFLFTFRKRDSLTGITAKLPDGTVIALVEKAEAPLGPDGPELRHPDDESPRQRPEPRQPNAPRAITVKLAQR